MPLFVAVALASIWPHLLPVDWFRYGFDIADSVLPLARRFSSPIGAFSGLILGLVLGRVVERGNRANGYWHTNILKLGLVFGLLGATLGWQSVTGLAVPFVMLLMLAREFRQAVPVSRPFDYFGVLLLLSILLLLSWRWLFTEFEATFRGLPYLASGILAVILAACFRFDHVNPDDRINV